MTFATFSPDGTRILTASEDKTARIWDSRRQTMPARELLLDTCARLLGLAKLTRDEMRLAGYPDSRSAALLGICTFRPTLHKAEEKLVKLRVGALPQYPSNALNYNLTWSTDGVINEYCEPCEAIVNGMRREVQPLEEREGFSLDGVTYEAFNTSGGLGTLCDTLDGKVRTLNYRTIRYPGHAAIMRALLNDLRLRDRREVLKDILEHAVPMTLQDVVIVFVTVSGRKNGQLIQETYANKIYSRDVDGRTLSAIQITTAAAVCTVVDLLATGQLPQTGFVRQEDIPLQVFLGNRFGQVYTKPETSVLHQQHEFSR